MAMLDGRTREAAYLRTTIADLTAHVGTPSAPEQRIIRAAAWIGLLLEKLNERAIDTGGLSERDSRQYLAWCNSYRRHLQALGLERRAGPAPSLADYLGGE